MIIPPHCARCRYFVPGQRVSTEAHDGSCHWGPPGNYSTPQPQEDASEPDEFGITTLTFVDGSYTGWPVVQSSDWCGMYEARRAPRKPKETS